MGREPGPQEVKSTYFLSENEFKKLSVLGFGPQEVKGWLVVGKCIQKKLSPHTIVRKEVKRA